MNEQRGREGTRSSDSSSAEKRRNEFASGPSHKSAQTSSERTPLHKKSSMNEQRGEANRSRSSSRAEQRREGFSGFHSQSADQIREHHPLSHPNIAEQTKDDHVIGSTSPTFVATSEVEHGAKSKETPSASTGRTKATGKKRWANLVDLYTFKELLVVFFIS